MRWTVVLLLVLDFGSLASAGDWPQWLGPKRDGATAEKVAAWKEDPAVTWRASVGEGYSVPVVAEGRVFIHARVAGKDREELLALDAATGKELWRKSYARAPYVSFLNTGPQSTPSVVKGRVYTFGITGVLTCWDATNGKQFWQADVYKEHKVDLPRSAPPVRRWSWAIASLLPSGARAAPSSPIDTEKGELAWKALDGPISTASPVVYLNRAKKGETKVEAVFVNGRSLVALDPFSGEVAWEHSPVG